MSTIKAGLAAFQRMQEEKVIAPLSKSTKVYIRVIFFRIGEIDTLNEKYHAQASIEARWAVDINQINALLSEGDQKRLEDGKSVTLLKYADSHWHPQLYIENALGELREQIRYSARRSREDNEIYVCESRDVKGFFWQKLDLHHFPSDVQDLSISVASMLYDDKVILLADLHHLSGVNREAFVDQQEWSLYQHVDTQQRFVDEFLARVVDDTGEGELDWGCNRKRSVVTVICHAARSSSYFYWNGYCLIFLITLMSLCIFAIPPHLVGNRLQIGCVLLLTSITFRWVVNRSLPTISYLTSLDKYAIICIFILVAEFIWHGMIGSVVFLTAPDSRATPSMSVVSIDHGVFFICLVFFCVLHIGLIVWLHSVPLKRRRKMKKRDAEYQRLMAALKKRCSFNNNEANSESVALFFALSIEEQ